ncbi:MAG: hypothetical protein KAS64_10730 [Spirochaetes bacterium]|nr:hypothetical protein [Spirochaetota bacterium]
MYFFRDVACSVFTTLSGLSTSDPFGTIHPPTPLGSILKTPFDSAQGALLPTKITILPLKHITVA